MKVTMKKIADSTGYSISTVSRVLNNSSRISDKAKRAIFDAAQKSGYKTALGHFSPQEKQLDNIALVTDFHEGEFYASYFYGFLQAAKNENVRLSLLNVYDTKRNAVTFVNQVASEGYFDGIILFIPELNHPEYISILKNLPESYPIISNAFVNNPKINTITFDGYSGGNQAAQHFEELGLQKVGIIRGPHSKAESQFRFNGFSDYVQFSQNMELLWSYEGNFEYSSGVDAFNNYKASGIKLDGVFASNDLMATAFIDSAKQSGYNVPEDIAVLGYDDLPMCVQNAPTISSIKTDFTTLGRYSLRQLEDKLRGEPGHMGTLSMIPVELIPRNSTLGIADSKQGGGGTQKGKQNQITV